MTNPIFHQNGLMKKTPHKTLRKKSFFQKTESRKNDKENLILEKVEIFSLAILQAFSHGNKNSMGPDHQWSKNGSITVSLSSHNMHSVEWVIG